MTFHPGQKIILSLFIVAIIGFAGGLLAYPALQPAPTIPIEAHDDHVMNADLPHEHGSEHVHAMHEVLPENAPTLSIHVQPDPVSGWNLELKTTNFTFSPEHAGHAHADGKGHAHLYIDGTKITRLYGNWYFIPELSPGTHTIRVTLNTNDHADYTINHNPIADEVVMEIK